jgi:site-specific recombinase XerD
MLANHFKSSATVNRLAFGPAAPFLEGFVQTLEVKGYADSTIQYHVCAVHHLCSWASSKALDFTTFDDSSFESFLQHLPSCHCNLASRGKFMHRARFSVALFGPYLREIGVLAVIDQNAHENPLLGSFRHWMLNHRGVMESTLQIYDRFIPRLLETFSGDASRITAGTLRAFFMERTKTFSAGYASNVANAIRVFARYLVAEGISPPGLDKALPPMADWRDRSLPRFLHSSDIERVIAACDCSTKEGLRDRAIVLLLVRLGLRASDVLRLRLQDLDWNDASIRVCGKGRREARLPLTQEVGDAVLSYLQSGRPPVQAHALFVRLTTPIQPFADSSAISGIASAAIRRAGIRVPRPGSHILRHSAATEMLRHGVSLQEIGSVLRHRSVDTTLHYAKVDRTLLRLVVQPWPEVPTYDQ